MRCRVAATIAVLGIAALAAVGPGAQASGASGTNVTVRPRSGSPRTHFVVRFRAAVAIGKAGPMRLAYRITAGTRARGRCQSSAAAAAPPSRAGESVLVTLAPRRSKVWCAGVFRGQVWELITEPCPPGEACPAIVPAPRMVGTFTFRVTRR